MAAPIDLEARRIEAAINEQRAIAEHAIDRAKEEWKKLAQMQQR
jgi:hypothetical protein